MKIKLQYLLVMMNMWISWIIQRSTSDSHNENFHDTSFNLTISHITEDNDAKVCTGNSNLNGNDDSSFFNESCRKLGGNNLIKTLLQKMNEENLLQHFMAFVDGICSGIISVSNILILLCLEYCYLMSLNTTMQMRYRDETCKNLGVCEKYWRIQIDTTILIW